MRQTVHRTVVFSYLRPTQLSADEHICDEHRCRGKLRCVETTGTIEKTTVSTEPENTLEEGEHMRTAMASTAKRDQEFSSTRQTTKTTLTPAYGWHDLQTPSKGTYCSFSSSERHDTAEQGKARSTQ